MVAARHLPAWHVVWRYHEHNRAHKILNPINAELNPICHLLALLGAHHILHVSRIRVKREEYKMRSS